MLAAIWVERSVAARASATAPGSWEAFRLAEITNLHRIGSPVLKANIAGFPEAQVTLALARSI